MLDAVRNYLSLAGGITEVTRQRAVAAAKALVSSGEATAEQIGTLAEDLVDTSRTNREAVTSLVRYETDRTLGRLGLATSEEVAALTRRLQALEVAVRSLRAAEAAGPVTEPVATPKEAAEPRAAAAPAPPAAPPAVSATSTPAKPAPAPAKPAKATPKAKPAAAAKATPPTSAAPKRASAAAKTAAPKTPAAKSAKTTGKSATAKGSAAARNDRSAATAGDGPA